MANPHEIEQNGKLITIDALLRYHHQLLEKLGLVQDTAEYEYNGGRGDFPEGINSVAGALDNLYDLTKSGAVTFTSGKHMPGEDEDDPEVVEFNSTDGEENNLYWINAKVGDNFVNIKLNADDFVKDSVLKSVALVNISEEDEDRVYKVNGNAATLEDEEGEQAKLVYGEGKSIYVDVDELASLDLGTYFYYTWITNNGEREEEYSFTAVSLKSVYGDLHDDDKGYVHYDKDKAEISVDTAEVKATPSEVTTYDYRINDLEGRAEILTAAGISFTEKSDDAGTYYEILNSPKTLDEIAELFEVTPETAGEAGIFQTGTHEGEGSKTWEVDSEDETNLATAENLANIAQDLQDQIDENKAKNTLLDGEVELSSEATEHSLIASVDETGSKYKLTLMTASSTDIDGLFKPCGSTDATSISSTSSVNGGATITEAGTYDINVGETPVGGRTDITWTPE